MGGPQRLAQIYDGIRILPKRITNILDLQTSATSGAFICRGRICGSATRNSRSNILKGKSQLLTKRLLVLDCSDKKECLDLLQAYLDVRQHVRGCKHFWELPSSKRWLASSIDDMLQRVLKLLPHHVPPPGCTWTGHSLRSGAASAGYAVTKDLLVICHYGGWARGSDVMQDDYIDPSWRSTPDARFFFGWLKSAL
ncbi:hypothetical protein RI054_23g98470 [Pseudoscourfieldia marina]